MIVRVLDGASIAGSTRRLDRKARELLTTLALHAPTALSVDELVSVLWDDPPPSAAKTVIAHLSRLRRALEDSGGGCGVERRGGHYRLVVTAATCDVLAIRQACLTADNLLENGRPDRAGEVLSAALALCPGQPELPDTVGALALRQAGTRSGDG
ncbi:MAG: winged helix-turn-helix domain-containing protein [Acidimicrobiales bacterium]